MAALAISGPFSFSTPGLDKANISTSPLNLHTISMITAGSLEYPDNYKLATRSTHALSSRASQPFLLVSFNATVSLLASCLASPFPLLSHLLSYGTAQARSRGLKIAPSTLHLTSLRSTHCSVTSIQPRVILLLKHSFLLGSIRNVCIFKYLCLTFAKRKSKEMANKDSGPGQNDIVRTNFRHGVQKIACASHVANCAELTFTFSSWPPVRSAGFNCNHPAV